MEGYVLGKLKLPAGHPWSKAGYDAVLGYETVCELALLTLDHYLKHSSREKLEAGISKIKQKLPTGFVYWPVDFITRHGEHLQGGCLEEQFEVTINPFYRNLFPSVLFSYIT